MMDQKWLSCIELTPNGWDESWSREDIMEQKKEIPGRPVDLLHCHRERWACQGVSRKPQALILTFSQVRHAFFHIVSGTTLLQPRGCHDSWDNFFLFSKTSQNWAEAPVGHGGTLGFYSKHIRDHEVFIFKFHIIFSWWLYFGLMH